MKRPLLLAPLLLLACAAPDPMTATYAYTISAGLDTQTAPSSDTSTPNGTGKLVITPGLKGDYLLTLAPDDASGCTLNATAIKDKPLELAFVAGQRCNMRQGSYTANVIVNTGALTLTPGTESTPARAVSFLITYSYSYTALLGIGVAGTGTRTYSGTEQ